MSGKFKMPEKPARSVESWVAGEETPSRPEAASQALEKPAGGKMARLTIDLPQDLHAQFKATCALRKTRMIDEVRGFIEEWTQKHR
jgi:hypothetical protein